MASPQQIANLKELYQEAKASQHIWPAMAACEACLESAWLTSELAKDYKNLFGQKQSVESPIFQSVRMPTQEDIGDRVVNIWASFVWFPSMADAFTARMDLLQRLQDQYPDYKAALHAATPEDYISSVSRKWSTDPLRAQKVLQIYNAHKSIFEA